MSMRFRCDMPVFGAYLHPQGTCPNKDTEDHSEAFPDALPEGQNLPDDPPGSESRLAPTSLRMQPEWKIAGSRP